VAIFTAIGTAIAAATTFFAGLGTIGTFALQAAVGIGLNYAAKALAGKPKQAPTQERGPQGVVGKLQSGGDLPRSVVFGRTCTAGSLVYAGTWGTEGKTPNAYLTQVIDVSDARVQVLEVLYVNGEQVTIDTGTTTDQGHPVLQYRSGGVDHLWVKFYDGTQTSADPFLVATFGEDLKRPYGWDRVGRGVAYAILTARVHESLWTGFPSFKFQVVGRPLYDPSKDTTAGGSGSQRWANPATWGGDGDHLPAVQLYNLMRGVTVEGQWLCGLQSLPAARLPATAWIEAINLCRATVDGPAGAEPAYRSGIEIAASSELASVVETLLTACQGRLNEAGGSYKLIVGPPGSPVLTFGDGDIISTEQQSFTPFFGLSDTVNGIAGKHPSPEEGWNTTTAPPLLRPDLEALDGARRLMADVNFAAVPYAGQVQRLMKSALEEARRARRHTFVLPPEAWVLEPGDVVSWTSERNGYETKLFRVDGVADKGNLDVMVDLTEVDPADYEWDQAEDFRPVAPAPLGVIRPGPQPIVDWVAQGVTVDGFPVPKAGILLSWDGDQPDVDFVEYEVRQTVGGAFVHGSTVRPVSRGATTITQSIVAATTYEVRGRYLALSGRPMLWSAWIGVTTPAISIKPSSVDAFALTREARKALAISHEVQNLVLEMGERIAKLQTTTIPQMRRELLVEGGERRAQYLELISATLGDFGAIISRVATLEATVTGAGSLSGISARVTEIETALVDIETDAGTAVASTRRTLDALRNKVGEISALVVETATAVAATTRSAAQIRQEMRVAFGDAKADYTRSIDLLVSDLAARAQEITVLSAALGPNVGAISAVNNAIVDERTARTQAVTSLTAAVGTKARTFAQTEPPVATAEGDLWIDTDDSQKLYRWNGSVWVLAADQRIAGAVADITTIFSTMVTASEAAAIAGVEATAVVNGRLASGRRFIYAYAGEGGAAVSFRDAASITVGGVQYTAGNRLDLFSDGSSKIVFEAGSVESGNYAGGVSGWQLNADGSANFRGAIKAADILSGAITTPIIALPSYTGPAQPAPNAWENIGPAQVVTGALRSNGTMPVDILFRCTAVVTGNSSSTQGVWSVNMRLLRDGNVVWGPETVFTLVVPPPNASATGSGNIVSFALDTPTHTSPSYQWQIQVTPGATLNNVGGNNVRAKYVALSR
jgi:hypothetical protein